MDMNSIQASNLGAETQIIICLPVSAPLPLGDPWRTGPLPVKFGDKPAKADLRRSYFYPAVADVLYGSTDTPSRWHVEIQRDFFSRIKIAALEVLLSREPLNQSGYLVLHLRSETPVAEELPKILDHVSANTRSVQNFLQEIGLNTIVLTEPSEGSRPFVVCYSTAEIEGTSDSESVNRVLFRLASGTSEERFPLSGPSQEGLGLPLSSSWQSLSLRDGLAFLAISAPDMDMFISTGRAAALVSSVYLDTVLLALLQRDASEALASELYAGTTQDKRRLGVREVSNVLEAVRSALWFGRISRYAIPNQLLEQLNDQQGTSTLLSRLIVEVESRAAYYRELHGSRLERFAMIIATLGIPTALVLGTGQIYHSGAGFGGTAVWAGSTVVLCAVAYLLWQRYHSRSAPR